MNVALVFGVFAFGLLCSLSLLLGLLVIALLVIVPILVRWPVLAVLPAFLIEETVLTSTFLRDASPLITSGFQLYRPTLGGSSLALIVMLTVLCLSFPLVSTWRHEHASASWGPGWFPLAIASLATWALLLSLSQAESAPGSLLAHAADVTRPWLLALAAYVLVRLSSIDDPSHSRLVLLVGASVVAKSLVALFVLGTNQTVTFDGQDLIVFYDSASPAIAAAVLLAVGFGLVRVPPWTRRVLIAASLIVVVFSFRRSVWAALVVGTILLPLVQHRMVVLRRVLAGIACLLVAALLVPGSTRATMFGRVNSAVAVAQGKGGEGAAEAHRLDIVRGYRMALRHPLDGVGIFARQPPGFAARTPFLYVHNEYLHTWLRLGLVGLGLLLFLIGRLMLSAVRVLARGAERASAAQTVAAAFCLTLPVPIFTAPFITTTDRWPMLIGIAAAVLRGPLSGSDQSSEAPIRVAAAQS